MSDRWLVCVVFDDSSHSLLLMLIENKMNIRLSRHPKRYCVPVQPSWLEAQVDCFSVMSHGISLLHFNNQLLACSIVNVGPFIDLFLYSMLASID